MERPNANDPSAALKFFRNLVGLQDEFYNQQMMQDRLFEPILNIVHETMPRDNLLNSACLELFEYIKRENIKKLIEHLVETYRNKLQSITYVDTFRALIARHDDSLNADTSFVDTEVGTPAAEQSGGRWQGVKDLDAAEEEYFNTSDDEEDTSKSSPANRSLVNGASPITKPLVDYNSDEETDNMETDMSAGIVTNEATENAESTTSDVLTDTTATPPATAPLERLSEKRRREEDEDDELGKLSQNKRRSSLGSVNSSPSHSLRRKKNLFGSKDSGTPKKMTISLGSSVTKTETPVENKEES
jgi:protein phosphatase-4 regulatory subunit 3